MIAYLQEHWVGLWAGAMIVLALVLTVLLNKDDE